MTEQWKPVDTAPEQMWSRLCWHGTASVHRGYRMLGGKWRWFVGWNGLTAIVTLEDDIGLAMRLADWLCDAIGADDKSRPEADESWLAVKGEA